MLLMSPINRFKHHKNKLNCKAYRKSLSDIFGFPDDQQLFTNFRDEYDFFHQKLEALTGTRTPHMFNYSKVDKAFEKEDDKGENESYFSESELSSDGECGPNGEVYDSIFSIAELFNDLWNNKLEVNTRQFGGNFFFVDREKLYQSGVIEEVEKINSYVQVPQPKPGN